MGYVRGVIQRQRVIKAGWLCDPISYVRGWDVLEGEIDVLRDDK